MSKKSSYYEGAMQSLKDSNDLKMRTQYLKDNVGFSFPDFKSSPEGESRPVTNSDQNRMKFLDILFDEGRGTVSYPYFDLFRGFPVDHLGVKIDENNSHAHELAGALHSVLMKNQNYDAIDRAYERWARQHKKNSLIERMEKETPPWDDEPRLEKFLVNFFNLRDTEINRQIGKYFWLSLYNRMSNPGCSAPISIALIGDQDVGKSYFSLRLCRTLLDNKKAIPITLSLTDIERNQNDWLRRITGKSVIANIGEMKGYKKTDIETVKEFMTRAGDDLHHKYANGIEVERQWIVIMDGNSYEGFQRDETGNRRFFPMFVNQGEDKEGQPWWPRKVNDDPGSDWSADFSNFDYNVWQLMAEAKEWMLENGDEGYHAYVKQCSAAVGSYSAGEMKRGSGIIRDDNTETVLQTLMLIAEYKVVSGAVNQGVFISNAEILRHWRKITNAPINYHAIKRTLTAYGYEFMLMKAHGRGYLLRNKMDAFEAKKYFYERRWEGDNCGEISEDEMQSIINSAMNSEEKF